MPISTGLQLASTSLLGVLAFGEWPATVTRYIGLLAVTIIIVGIILTTWQQKKNQTPVNIKKGLSILLISTIGYLGFSAFPRMAGVSGWEAFMTYANSYYPKKKERCFSFVLFIDIKMLSPICFTCISKQSQMTQKWKHPKKGAIN